MSTAPDAVIIGAGHNGLVAANLLLDAGWSVLVVEEAAEPGGAIRSGELIEPSFTNDLFSSFYPFALASPHLGSLELERWGVRWISSPVAVAHPAADGTCPAVCLDIERTVESLEECAPGDGEGWRDLYALWRRVREDALGAFFAPFPPVTPVLRLLARLGPRELLRLARFAVLPVRRMGEESFTSDGGTRLLAGNALHADITPEMALGGAFGWVLCSLAQDHGFPVPEGGSGRITDALVARLRAGGGELRCGERAVAIEVAGGRARAIRLSGGERLAAARAVIADVGAPQLYRELLDPTDAARRTAPRARPLPVRQRDVQGRLDARRADPVVGASRPRGGNGPRRGGRRRAHPPGRPARPARAAERALPGDGPVREL